MGLAQLISCAVCVEGTHFESMNEVGVFAKLTNSYCLVAVGGSEHFYSSIEAELAHHIPVIHATVGGTRVLGRVCVGMRSHYGPLQKPSSCSC